MSLTFQDRVVQQEERGIHKMKTVMMMLVGSVLGAWCCNGAEQAASPATPQVYILCQLLEMPPATYTKLFGANGAVPGGEVSDDLLQRIQKEGDVEVLSAPRVTTLSGRSAQIKICQERSFATSFRVVETNGAWEPVNKTVELGVALTVMATTCAQDPERVFGASEVILSELVGVSEQTVTPPGQNAPLKLQSPAVQTRSLATSFDVHSGKTTVLGGLDTKNGDKAKRMIVLIKVQALSPVAELVRKFKAIRIDMEVKDATLDEVAEFLAAQSRLRDPEKIGGNIIVKAADQASLKVTLSLRNVSIHDALAFVAKLSGSTLEYDSNVVILRK